MESDSTISFGGREFKAKIRRRRLILKDGQETAEYKPPQEPITISFTAELTPEGVAFFSQFLKEPEIDEATELGNAVERWLQSAED